MQFQCIPYGYRWVGNKLCYNKEWIEQDQHIPIDKHTCQIIVALANSINPAIQFVGDVASDYPDKYVPILDMAVRMITIEVPENTDDGTPAYSYQNVEYKFFKKKMARKTIMMSTSAMPENIRRETLVNECVRRIANTSQNHPNTKVNTVEAVNDYMVFPESQKGHRHCRLQDL